MISGSIFLSIHTVSGRCKLAIYIFKLNTHANAVQLHPTVPLSSITIHTGILPRAIE